MTINKYTLYIIVLLTVFSIFLIPRLYVLLNYHRTNAIVTGFHNERLTGKSGWYTNSYPIIEFDTEKDHITFYAPSYMYETVKIDSLVQVIYNPKQPTNVYVNNFYGLWGKAFIFLLPFFLIWTICIFSVNFIPRNIKLPKYLK